MSDQNLITLAKTDGLDFHFVFKVVFFTPFSLLTDVNVAYSRPTANPVHAHGTCQKAPLHSFHNNNTTHFGA